MEKNKPQLALAFLEKAKAWISDIINDVKKIVEKYKKHNSDVAASTSDIITEKDETEQKQKQQTVEMEALQKIVEDLKEKLHNINEKTEDSEKKIEEKNAEIQQFISKITDAKEEQTSMMGSKVSWYSMMVPFAGNVYDYLCKLIKSRSDKIVIEAFNTSLSTLTKEQQRLKEQQWDIQNKLMDKQLQLAKLRIENGQLPCDSHLNEVQTCLSQIQQILVQLQKFWEKVGSLLDTLKEETFAGDVFIKDLANMKEHFLESINEAKQGWKKFGISCMKANQVFSVQSSQAYRFLEINPSSLTKDEWQKEYQSVKEKLETIKPNTVNEAITQ